MTKKRRDELAKVLEKPNTKNPLSPTPALLCKLGSIVVHADELHSPGGHMFDKTALDQLLADPEVKEWLQEMTKMAMVPLKRN